MLYTHIEIGGDFFFLIIVIFWQLVTFVYFCYAGFFFSPWDKLDTGSQKVFSKEF